MVRPNSGVTHSTTTVVCYVLSDASVCVDIFINFACVCLNNSNNALHPVKVRSQESVSSLWYMYNLRT